MRTLQEKKEQSGVLAARARLRRTCCLSALKESCRQTYTGVSARSQSNSAMHVLRDRSQPEQLPRQSAQVERREACATHAAEEVSFDPRPQSAYNVQSES